MTRNEMKGYDKKLKMMKFKAETLPDILANTVSIPLLPKNEHGKDNPDILCVTNTMGINGATILLFPEELAKISQIYFGGNDLVILPSSIHEVIVLNGNLHNGEDCAGLTEIVTQVNRDQVKEGEVLSDDPFWFSMKECRLCLMKDKEMFSL